MSYQVNIRKQTDGIVLVDATSPEEAWSMALDAVNAGQMTEVRSTFGIDEIFEAQPITITEDTPPEIVEEAEAIQTADTVLQQAISIDPIIEPVIEQVV